MRKIGWALGKDELEKAGVHASEYSWVGSKFDLVLENDGTIDQLYTQIQTFLSSQEQDPLDAILDQI